MFFSHYSSVLSACCLLFLEHQNIIHRNLLLSTAFIDKTSICHNNNYCYVSLDLACENLVLSS